MSVAIHIERLVKIFGGAQEVRAVDHIDLQVPQGEIFGLLGPNGAGKTTTVGVCTTRVLPTSGRVMVHGVDVVADPPRARKSIGVVTQHNTLDRACSAWDNIYFHCRYFGMPSPVAGARADELLTQFRLGERARSLPGQLSGGMVQRLQLARALAHRPRVLFLDEPTAGLDPQSRLALWELVEGMRQSGVTVLLTTHYMEEADRLCDRVAIIDHGKILVCGPPAELKRGLGAQTVLALQLDPPSQELATSLRQLPGVTQVEVTATGLRLFASSRDGLIPRVAEAAQSYNLRDISITEPTLETVFISLTGRELRE